MDGGGHEKGMRSGTLNVPGIVGFGKACEIAGLSMEKEASRLAAMRDKLQNAVLQIQDTYINGDTSSRLPHVCNVSFADVDGEALLLGLTKNIAVSSGSACTSASMEPSYVLKALGVEDNLAYSSIRFSLGRFTGENEVDFAIDLVSKTVKRLREESIVRRL
jgi:cysteine desulfurase